MTSKRQNYRPNSATKIKNSFSTKLFFGIGLFLITVFALICLIPFIMLISGSFSSENEIVSKGYSLLPRSATLNAYKSLVPYADQLLDSYVITAGFTVVGTALTVFFTTIVGYALSRNEFKARNAILFFIYYTTLFSGGLTPWYIVITQCLHLKNSFWVYVIPSLMGPFNIFLVKNFLKSIPDSLVESARIDGANEFFIYRKIIVPLAKPCIATITLFTSLGHWNNWYMSSIFINDSKKFSLQYVLYNIMQNANYFEQQAMLSGNMNAVMNMPRETTKLAMALITIGPVILFYPFLQRYFVEGLTIGSVKG